MLVQARKAHSHGYGCPCLSGCKILQTYFCPGTSDLITFHGTAVQRLGKETL